MRIQTASRDGADPLIQLIGFRIPTLGSEWKWKTPENAPGFKTLSKIIIKNIEMLFVLLILCNFIRYSLQLAVRFTGIFFHLTLIFDYQKVFPVPFPVPNMRFWAKERTFWGLDRARTIMLQLDQNFGIVRPHNRLWLIKLSVASYPTPQKNLPLGKRQVSSVMWSGN